MTFRQVEDYVVRIETLVSLILLCIHIFLLLSIEFIYDIFKWTTVYTKFIHLQHPLRNNYLFIFNLLLDLKLLDWWIFYYCLFFNFNFFDIFNEWYAKFWQVIIVWWRQIVRFHFLDFNRRSFASITISCQQLSAWNLSWFFWNFTKPCNINWGTTLHSFKRLSRLLICLRYNFSYDNFSLSQAWKHFFWSF